MEPYRFRPMSRIFLGTRPKKMCRRHPQGSPRSSSGMRPLRRLAPCRDNGAVPGGREGQVGGRDSPGSSCCVRNPGVLRGVYLPPLYTQAGHRAGKIREVICELEAEGKATSVTSIRERLGSGIYSTTSSTPSKADYGDLGNLACKPSSAGPDCPVRPGPPIGIDELADAVHDPDASRRSGPALEDALSQVPGLLFIEGHRGQTDLVKGIGVRPI